MNELTNISYNVGEVVENLESAKIYAQDKKFEDFEVAEIAEGLKHIASLENVTAFEIAFRLLSVKEHAKSANQLGKLIGQEKADIYEFSKAYTGKSKGRTSEYIKVAETFRYRDDTSKYIPNKEKYYLDEVASRFNFDTLLLVAKSKDLPMLSDKYKFLEGLNDGVTALEVKDLLRHYNEEETEEETEEPQTEEPKTEENAENVLRETFEEDFSNLSKTLQEGIRKWVRANLQEEVSDLLISNIKF